MTWIIFRQCLCLQTSPCVLFFTNLSLTLEEAEQLPNLKLDNLLSKFDGSVRTKKSINGVYKTNIDCPFIRGALENYCPLGESQPWPTIQQGL